MKPLLYIVLPTCLSIILLFSCQSKRENSLLLQNQGFKLWLIVNDKQNNDSIEWIQLGDFKIESFWKEYERGKGYSSDYSFDQLWFRNYISQTDGPRLFMKKGDVPEYLYFDSDGYACKLFFDRKAGNFFDRKNPVMTGLWKLKNDSILIINNNRFSFKQIDANPITLLVRDFKTGNTITIKDAFPDVSWHYAPWKDEYDKSHLEKWGFGIKDSPLLQGNDYKLWREEKNYGFEELINPSYETSDYCITKYYYYCMFMYFDKYGRYADLAIAADEWRIWDHGYFRINNDDLEYQTSWYPNGNDSTFCSYGTVSISYTHPDTLNIREVVKGRKERFIAINLPPKSKLNWEKSRKR